MHAREYVAQRLDVVRVVRGVDGLLERVDERRLAARVGRVHGRVGRRMPRRAPKYAKVATTPSAGGFAIADDSSDSDGDMV